MEHRPGVSILGLLWLALLCFPIVGVAAPELRLATTNGAIASGILKALLPGFEARYGGKVRVIGARSDEALKLAESGEVDVVLVQSRNDEEKFVAEGYGINRREVMYSELVLVGPKHDPAWVRGGKDITDAFETIAKADAKFVTRGDDSDTNRLEKLYWSLIGTRPTPENYVSVQSGMADVIKKAQEINGYALTDRATFNAAKLGKPMEILVAGDPRLREIYGVLAVNPERHPKVNQAGAAAFIEWLTSPETQSLIAGYKLGGETVFMPLAKKTQ